MADTPVPLADALTQAAAAINRTSTLQETLDSIVLATRTSVPGFDHVGISLVHRDGTIETRSGTGQLVNDLDELQYGLGEGPCYESITDDRDVVAERALLAGLQPGQPSRPIVTSEGVAIVMACSREQKNVAEPTKEEVKNRLLSERVELVARQLQRDLRRRAVLDERTS